MLRTCVSINGIFRVELWRWLHNKLAWGWTRFSRSSNVAPKCCPPTDGETSMDLLISVDEVHALLRQPSPPSNATESADEENSDRYGSLLRAIDHLRCLPVFFVLLSTQSRMSVLAPSHQMATSDRYIAAVPRLPVPLTETPFDCHKDIDFSAVEFDTLSDVAHLSQYGRPL